jgi:hypothetical protein
MKTHISQERVRTMEKRIAESMIGKDVGLN